MGQHHAMMSTWRATAFLLTGLIIAVGVVAWPRGATADKPAGCPQWEVMVGQATRITIDAKSLPEAGKPLIEQAPPGWEPFAFAPAGQLVYRRCAR